MCYLMQKWLEFFEFFVRPHVVVGKYLEILHVGEGESIVLLRTNWEISLTYSPSDNLWSIYEIIDGDRKVLVMCLFLCGSVCHFDIAWLQKFTNHDSFALTVRYRSQFIIFLQVYILLVLQGATLTHRICELVSLLMSIPSNRMQFTT